MASKPTTSAPQNGYAARHPEASVRTRFGTKVMNSSFIGSGALGVGDRGGYQNVALNDSNPYSSNDYVYRWRQYAMLYETCWEARKIIRIPVEDALRKPWMVEGLDEKDAKAIETKLTELRFFDVLKRSLMLERLFGGCLTFFGLEDAEDDPSKEYHAKKEKARLRFCNSIPISRIARVNWCTDPLSEHYMRPDAFMINGQEVHTSRCLVWDGEPLFDPYDYALTQFRSNLAGFGPSKLAPIWDDIIKAVGTRQAAYQLIQINGSIIAAIQGLQDLNGTNPGKATLNKLKEIANSLSVFRAALLDGEKVDIQSLNTSFGSVPELLMMYLQVLSAASDIPATRFIGQAPGGLNATGESDLENYYNSIDAYQRQRIEPQLRRTYDVIGYSFWRELWLDMRKKLEFKFPPLWNTKEGEQADVAGKRIDNALKLWSERAISDKKFVEEINAQGALSVTLDKDDIALMEDFREQLGTEGVESPVDATKEISRLKNMVFVQNADAMSLLVREAGYDPSVFNADEIKKGYLVEQEHADVTDGKPEEVMKIVMAHLTEVADYYTRLEAMEKGKSKRTENAKGYYRASPSNWCLYCGTTDRPLHAYGQKNNPEYLCDKCARGREPIPSEKADRWNERFKSSRTNFHNIDPLRATTSDDWARRTAAQISAGNYKKDHYRIHGLDIAIENPVGSTREGQDELGRNWSTTMVNPYGYIKGYIGRDKDHVDLFLGPDPENHGIVVIDQINAKTGEFDEHKIMFGFPTQVHAMKAYLDHYDETGLDRIGTLNPVITADELKDWLNGGNLRRPYAEHKTT